jgi:hypothetical protein
MKIHISLIACVCLAACGSSKKPDDMAVAPDLSTPDLATPTTAVQLCIQAPAGPDGGVNGVVFQEIDYSILGTSLTGTFLNSDGCDNNTVNVPVPAAGAAPSPLAIAVTGIADTQGSSYESVTILGAVFPPASPGGLDSVITGASTITDSDATAYYTAGGLTYPSTSTSFVIVHFYDITTSPPTPISGATATISPASGKVVYADATGTLSAALTSTSASGGVVFGNIAPGKLTITVSAPGRTCQWNVVSTTPQFAAVWPPTGSNVVAATVAAGTAINDIEMSCK